MCANQAVRRTRRTMSRLRFADYAQRGVTLCLFGITMYGALIVSDGAFNIINRRRRAGPAVKAPKPTDSEDSKKA